MLSISPLFFWITIILNDNKSLQVTIVFFFSFLLHSNEKGKSLGTISQEFPLWIYHLAP